MAKGRALMDVERLPKADSPRRLIRQYLPADRESIRQLVLACADQRIFATCLRSRHRLMSDVLTRYYLDFEPASCWVVDDPACGAVGYLLGCLSTARRWRFMASRIAPAVVFRAVFTGTAFSCPVGRLAWAGLRTWTSSHAVKSQAALEYPAHLHVGVHEDHRRSGLARELVLRFIRQARNEDIPGIHVSVMEANLPARRLFRSVGFSVLGRYEAVLPGLRSPVRMLLLGMPMTSSAVSRPEEAQVPVADGGV
jgi:ribosomal protein S18 acetylase RimI-like enzyme